MLKENLARNVQAKREAMGLTQEQVAKMCGISVRSFGQIERGRANPQLSTLEKVCAVLEIAPRDLFA